MSPADSTLALGKHILKVRLAGHRGRTIVDIRFFYQPAGGGPLKPGLRGVTLPADSLPEVIEALERLKAQMVRDGALEYCGEGMPAKYHPHVYPTDF